MGSLQKEISTDLIVWITSIIITVLKIQLDILKTQEIKIEDLSLPSGIDELLPISALGSLANEQKAALSGLICCSAVPCTPPTGWT